PEMELETFYGQLTHIYHVHVPTAFPALDLNEPTSFIFAAIRECKLKTDDAQLDGLDIHFYSKHGQLNVMDVKTAQALVGRVPSASNEWAIVDRSAALVQA
ncbi:hypothetical protein FB45DRAFT_679331, partial [Roridomyces roridus]